MTFWSSRKRELRKALHKEQDGLCAICFEPVRIRECTLDHILPKSLGGKDKRSNLRVAHQNCNSQRGNSLEGIT